MIGRSEPVYFGQRPFYIWGRSRALFLVMNVDIHLRERDIYSIGVEFIIDIFVHRKKNIPIIFSFCPGSYGKIN